MADDNSHIRDLDPCLPEEYLRAFAEGKVSEPPLKAAIEAHVGLCAQCGAKVRSFIRSKLSPDELMAKQLASLRQRQDLVKRNHAQGPQPGTIWRTVPWTKNDPSGPLVVVLGSPHVPEKDLLSVAEVSEDISHAIATDMILDPVESGLRFRCMVRAGNIFVMHCQYLDRFAGELPKKLTEKALEFCKLGERFDERVPLSQFAFLQDSEGHKLIRRKGVISGMPVTRNDDPRLGAVARSKSLCEYLHAAEPQTEKPVSRPVDKHHLISLLTGLVSKLSMWGSLLIPEPPPKPAYTGGGFTESASLRTGGRKNYQLSRSSSLKRPQDRPKPEPVKVEVKLAGPTREEVRQRQPGERKFECGNQIRLSVTVPEDGHMVIVHYCEQTGHIEIVFPTPKDRLPRVTSKQTVSIERQLLSPPGRYEFKVIFSREPLMPLQQETVATQEQTLQNLMALVERIEVLDEGTWREATFEYEIVKRKGLFSRWFS